MKTWTALLLLLGLTGCGSVTEIVLVVFADPQIADSIVSVTVTAESSERTDSESSSDISANSFPLTLTLVPRQGAPQVRVQVRADMDGGNSLEQSFRTAFVRDSRRQLRIYLEPNCVDRTCPAAETCVDGQCIDNQVAPEDLPLWEGLEPRLDAGTRSDAFRATDAPTRVDAGAPCDPSVNPRCVCARDDDCFGSRCSPFGVCLASQPAAIAIGETHACILPEVDGPVFCVGNNDLSQLGNPSPAGAGPTEVLRSDEVDFLTIAAGSAHTCGLTSGRNVVCWGENSDGQVTGTPSDPMEITGALDLRSAVGTVQQLSLGTRHSCARFSNGQVWCWGANDAGQLGIGSRTAMAGVQQVVGIADAVELATGGSHTCVVRDGDSPPRNREAWCWGNNGRGQCGSGSEREFEELPVAVSPREDAEQANNLSSGGAHSCFQSGTAVYCWGDDRIGQVGDGGAFEATVPTATALLGIAGCGGVGDEMQLGTNHSLVACGRTVYGWGSNAEDQLELNGDTPIGGETGTPLVVGQNIEALWSGGAATCWWTTRLECVGLPLRL